MWNIRRVKSIWFFNPDNLFVLETVDVIMLLGLENQGLSLVKMKKREWEALALVGMLDFKKREPQRVYQVAKINVWPLCVVALRPAILILDEATSMLDPEGGVENLLGVK